MICKECKCTCFKVLKRAHKIEMQRTGAVKKQKGAFEY